MIQIVVNANMATDKLVHFLLKYDIKRVFFLQMTFPYKWQPDIVDIQVYRIGQLAILIVPGEFTWLCSTKHWDLLFTNIIIYIIVILKAVIVVRVIFQMFS